MRLRKPINDGAPLWILQTERVEDIEIAIHAGDGLGTPFIVEAHAHQSEAFDDRAIRRKVLLRRRHDAGPLLKAVRRVRTHLLFQLVAQKKRIAPQVYPAMTRGGVPRRSRPRLRRMPSGMCSYKVIVADPSVLLKAVG